MDLVNPVPGLAWHRIGTIPASVEEVVGFEGGYVALDSDGGTVASSPDGKTWRVVKLPLPPSGSVGDANGRVGRAIATNGHQVLVVGGYSHAPCATPEPTDGDTTGGPPECELSPLAWLSDDGVSWRIAYPGPPDEPYSEFVAVWPVTGGWEAAVSSWSGVCLGGQSIWRSADGIAWTESKPGPPEGWEGYDRVPLPVTAGSGRLVLVTSTRDAQTGPKVLAVDGGGWVVVNGFPSSGAIAMAGAGPTTDHALWVLAGSTTTADYDSFTPTIWTSSDLVRWKTTPLPMDKGQAGPWAGATGISVNSTAMLGGGYIAVGANVREDAAAHGTWLSPDGSTWVQLPGSGQGNFDYGPGLVADGPAGVIGIGASPTDPKGASAVWQLR